jgi:hypothetical protein
VTSVVGAIAVGIYEARESEKWSRTHAAEIISEERARTAKGGTVGTEWATANFPDSPAKDAAARCAFSLGGTGTGNCPAGDINHCPANIEDFTNTLGHLAELGQTRCNDKAAEPDFDRFKMLLDESNRCLVRIQCGLDRRNHFAAAGFNPFVPFFGHLDNFADPGRISGFKEFAEIRAEELTDCCADRLQFQ